MLHPSANLSQNLFSDSVSRAATRDGFGVGAVEAGKDTRIVVVCADLKESTRAEIFEKAYPERYVEIGVAEQHMAAFASGMAAAGKIPFITSYAVFSPGRNYEQIRTTIALNDQPVKICGMHAGVSVGPDGATHQMLEDIALMRVLPNMTVIAPLDAEEARKAVVEAAKTPHPVYLRFGRAATPLCTTPDTPFVIGKALTLWEGTRPKVALLSTGSLGHQVLVAARALEAEGISVLVLHVPTIKPLDTEAVLVAARNTGRVVTIEEHQVAGGFGGAISEFLSETYPVPMRRIGIKDVFGESGEPDELLSHFGLDAPSIIDTVRAFTR